MLFMFFKVEIDSGSEAISHSIIQNNSTSTSTTTTNTTKSNSFKRKFDDITPNSNLFKLNNNNNNNNRELINNLDDDDVLFISKNEANRELKNKQQLQ